MEFVNIYLGSGSIQSPAYSGFGSAFQIGLLGNKSSTVPPGSVGTLEHGGVES